MEIQLLSATAILRKTLLKLKISREEIQEKNGHRTDLINSMLETENELSEVLNTFLVLEKQARIFSSTSNSLLQINMELKFKIKQLENEIESNNF
jgi:hypothetical protein